jgi:hypothetical protein
MVKKKLITTIKEIKKSREYVIATTYDCQICNSNETVKPVKLSWCFET